MKSFIQAVALITVFSVSTRAIGFLFRIFLSRILGPEMLGVYQISMSFFMVFLTIIASGLPLTISKEVAKAKERNAQSKEIGTIAITGLVIGLLTSIALCGIIFVFRGALDKIFTDTRCINILIILLPSIIASSIYTALRAVWWGEKKFFLLGATELLEQLIRVVFFVILIAISFAGLDEAGLAGLSFTIACFVSAGAVVLIYLKGKKHPPSSKLPNQKIQSFYSPLIRSAAPITGVRVIASIALPIISIIIPMQLVAGGWTQTQAISQYGIVVGMTLPLLTIPGTIISAFATALVPELSGATQRKDYKSISQQIAGAMKFTIFITFAILPVFIALGEPIGLFLYDNSLSGVYLSKTAWVMVPLAMNQTTNAILNSMGAETRAMWNYVLGSIALFAIVWFTPPILEANALTIGLGACMLIATTLNLLMITKMTNQGTNPNPNKCKVIKQIGVFTAICIPSILIGEYIYGVVKHIWPLVISLPLAGAASLITVLLLCKTFNLVDFSTVLPQKKQKPSSINI